jgi:hypothetical protein
MVMGDSMASRKDERWLYSRIRSPAMELPRRSARPHVHVLVFTFFFFFLSSLASSLQYRLVSDNKHSSSCDTTRDDIHVPIPILPASLPLSFNFSFLLHFSSRAIGRHLLTQSRYHAAAVHTLFHLILVFFFLLCAYIFSI